MEDWWNQIDTLAEKAAIHDVRISPEIKRHPEYVIPEFTPHLAIVHVQQIQKATHRGKTLDILPNVHLKVKIKRDKVPVTLINPSNDVIHVAKHVLV